MLRINKTVKKTIAILLAVMLMISVVACGKNETNEGGTNNNEPAKEFSIEDLETEVTSGNVAQYDFSDKAMKYLEYIGKNLAVRVMDEDPDDNKHDEAVAWIKEELIKAGYKDSQIEEQKGECDYGKINNIILSVEGKDTSKTIIVGAHYDGDGCGDNGSGTALLLATAVGLVDITPYYNIKFVFFDAEEVGMEGSYLFVENMTEEEIANTAFCINMDALSFGDYANIYGGNAENLDNDDESDDLLGAYNLAVRIGQNLGIKVWGPDALDGYFNEHGTGPEIEDNALYTNPWTKNNPAPINHWVNSPATIPASDHVPFDEKGIPYVYFEATNWFAAGNDEYIAYTGYYETYDTSLGDGGMFMNTKYDTWENLNNFFPGRARKHFEIYSKLLSALLMVR